MMDSRTINAWVKTRAPGWQALAKRVGTLQGEQYASIDQAQSVVDEYRSTARDLSSARSLLPGSRTTSGLEVLYAQLHAVIGRKPRGGWAAIVALLREQIPRTIRELRARIAWIVLLFVVAAAAGAWLISTYPTLVTLIASDTMIEHVENGKLWTDDILNITPSSVMSVRIFSNNIMVSVFAVCAGVFFGLGTFYIIALNGLMLGGTFAFVHQHGLAGRLFEFVIAHGPVELSVICIAGAIGAAIGESLIRPDHGSRRQSFQECVHRIGPLLILCALFLVGAGLIEGFISPNSSYPLASKVVIGCAYWILMCAVLSGRLGSSRARH